MAGCGCGCETKIVYVCCGCEGECGCPEKVFDKEPETAPECCGKPMKRKE